MPKFLIPFTMDGEVEIEAASREDAEAQVERMSTVALTEHLDDLQVFPAETPEEREAQEAEWKAQLNAGIA